MRELTPEKTFLDSLQGKTVALVGAAESIQGTGAGPGIDAHDVVVRVNNGFIFPTRLSQDLGTWTDVVYHTGVINTRDGKGVGHHPIENQNRVGVRNLHPRDIVEMCRAGTSHMMLVVPPHSKRVSHVQNLDVPPMLEWSHFDRDHRTSIHGKIGTMPNTGWLAAWHLLQSRLDVLNLYGFDFFTTPHFEGYNNETEEYRVTAGTRPTDRPHDQEKQIDWVGKMWTEDARLILPREAAVKVRDRGWR